MGSEPVAARTFAVFPRRPRKTFKLGRFRPTDGFARQVHDLPQFNCQSRAPRRTWGPAAARPQFRAGLLRAPVHFWHHLHRKTPDRYRSFPGSKWLLVGVQRTSRMSQRPSPPHPGRAPGAPKEVKSAARLQFSLALHALKVAAGGKRNAKVSSGPTDQPLQPLLGPPEAGQLAEVSNQRCDAFGLFRQGPKATANARHRVRPRHDWPLKSRRRSGLPLYKVLKQPQPDRFGGRPRK